MRFSVPKFTEREMKIMGNLTLPHFVFLLILFMFSVLIWKFIDPTRGIALGVSGLLLYAILVGKKIEGIPLISVLPHLFNFLFSGRIYVWRGGKSSGSLKEIKIETKKEIPLKKGGSVLQRKKFLTDVGQKQ